MSNQYLQPNDLKKTKTWVGAHTLVVVVVVVVVVWCGGVLPGGGTRNSCIQIQIIFHNHLNLKLR